MLTAVVLALGLQASVPAPDAERTRLVLLGTRGGPRVEGAGGRRNASTLIVVKGSPYVVDCGYGTSLLLLAAGVSLNRLRHVFVTHHHSDHNLELGLLPYNGWVAGLGTPVDAYGPPGTEAMLQAFFRYMQIDIDTRVADEGRPDLRRLVDVGKVAAAAKVRTLVLSHFVPGDDRSITDANWSEGVRKHFTGTVIVGRDLMEIP